jgi:hypothetical protein
MKTSKHLFLIKHLQKKSQFVNHLNKGVEIIRTIVADPREKARQKRIQLNEGRDYANFRDEAQGEVFSVRSRCEHTKGEISDYRLKETIRVLDSLSFSS